MEKVVEDTSKQHNTGLLRDYFWLQIVAFISKGMA